jgi:hypothetical protein
MSKEEFIAELVRFKSSLQTASESGVLDQLSTDCHPDLINNLCDAVVEVHDSIVR